MHFVKNFLITVPLLALMVVALAPHQVVAGNAGVVVDLVLLPATQNVNAGGTFDITIQAQCNGQDVVGIDAYINFSPSRLEVVDSDAVTAGIQIAPGSTLTTVLLNSVDNAAGTINYSAGTFTTPFPSGTFTVATIRFQAKNITAGASASITFNTPSGANPARKTVVTSGAATVLRNTAPATIDIQGSGSAASAPAGGAGSAPASGAAPTSAPVTVTSAIPFHKATDVPVNSVISIIFNEAMNTASVQSALSISPAVSGGFSWSGKVMTFKPDGGFVPGTTYSVTISTGAQSAAGRQMPAPYTLSFTTATQKPPVAVAPSPVNEPAKPPAVEPNKPVASALPGTAPSPPPSQAATSLTPPPAVPSSPLPAPETTNLNWWLIGGIIGGVAVVLVILYFVFIDWIRRD